MDADGRRHERVSLVLRHEGIRVLHRAPVLRRPRFVQRHPGQEAPDAGLSHGPCDLVLPVEQVVEARRAGPDHFDAAEQGSNLDVPSGELRVDCGRLRQHFLQRNIVRDSAQQGVWDVVVEVDQPRQNRAPRAVDDFVRGAIHLSDRHDAAVLHPDVAREPSALSVLRDNRAAA